MSSKIFSKRHPLFLSFLFLFSSSSAFNITQILSEYDEFSTYTNLLGQTNVADDINKRQSITLLIVENSAFKPFTGQSNEVVKNVMSLHVILDYFDKQKLENLDKKTALLTTLFQSTGQAKDKHGFLNVTVSSDGKIAFGSAVPGAQLNAKFVKSVTSQPYNISVLQVSSLIAPPGTPATETPSSSSPPDDSPAKSESSSDDSPAKSESPGASPEKSEAPAASPPNEETPAKSPGKAPKPSASGKSPTPSTADSPDASSPTAAEEPSAAESPTDSDSPMGSAPEPIASGGPAADGPAAAGPSSAAASIDGVKMCALAVIFASTWSLF